MERYDKDFLGLEVVSLQDASVVGEIEGLIIDDRLRTVAALIVNTGSYRSGVLPYGQVRGVGDDAVVIESAAAIRLINETPELEALVDRDVALLDSYVLTQRGQLLGRITGYLLDGASGRITKLAVIQEEDGEDAEAEVALLIPADTIATVGSQVVIVSAPLPEATGGILTAGDLQGLPIISTSDGRILAEIDAVVMEDSQASLAGFLVNLGLYEPQVMSFADVEVIGPDAVLTGRAEAITPLSARPELEALAERRLSVEGARTVTISGKSVGFVLQYYINPADGTMAGLQFLPETGRTNESAEGYLLPLAKVVKMGRELVVVQDDFASTLERVDQPCLEPTAEPAVQGESVATQQLLDLPAERRAGALEDEGSVHAQPTLQWAVEEQRETTPDPTRHYLLGRRVLRKLETSGGRLIADIGDVVTPEVIEQARTSDLLLVLSLNVA